MRQLLLDIQTRLRTQITYVEDTAIHILISPDVLPHHTQLPAIGISDGMINYSYPEPKSKRQLVTLNVRISAYQSIPRGDVSDAPILGSGTIKGILVMIDDINAALINWKLGGATNYYVSRPLSEEHSIPLGQEEVSEGRVVVRPWVQRKTILFEFVRQGWV